MARLSKYWMMDRFGGVCICVYVCVILEFVTVFVFVFRTNPQL